jgi:hypothetical protein
MPLGRGTAGRRLDLLGARPSLVGFALALLAAGVASAGCFPNADALRPKPSSSSGSGGTAAAVGGSTGSGGIAGTAGHSGAGGAGAGGNGSGGNNGSGGIGAPGSGGRVGTGGSAPGVGGMTAGVGGGAGYVGSGLALTPDPTGFIAAGSNAVGITGSWYAFGDGNGPDGTTVGGACENAGHPPAACSMISSPSLTNPSFPNSAGKMCMTGVAARVVNNASTGQPDFGGIYGVTIGFDFNYPAIAPPKGTFNALAAGITGIEFDIDVVPSNGLRVQFVTPGTDLGPGGPVYWGGSRAFFASPVSVGTNRIYWADVTGPYGLGLDPTKLVSMYFNVPTLTTGADPFHLCISNVTLIRDPEPAGRNCSSQTFPVYCPGANGAAADCWNAGVNCNSVTSCSGVSKACFGQAQTDYFDCTMNMCLRCSGTLPEGCPALGTVPAGCWPANADCSTLTDCGGGLYESCTDPSLLVDCATLTCF